MANKIKLTGIELEAEDGKKIQLSLGEAKELHRQLDELFGFAPIIGPEDLDWLRRGPFPWASPDHITYGETN